MENDGQDALESGAMGNEIWGGAMMPYTIETIRKKAVPIAKNHGVKRMGLFGSYAKGEAGEESDIDISC